MSESSLMALTILKGMFQNMKASLTVAGVQMAALVWQRGANKLENEKTNFGRKEMPIPKQFDLSFSPCPGVQNGPMARTNQPKNVVASRRFISRKINFGTFLQSFDNSGSVSKLGTHTKHINDITCPKTLHICSLQFNILCCHIGEVVKEVEQSIDIYSGHLAGVEFGIDGTTFD